MGLHLNWDLRLDASCAEAHVDALLLELLGFARQRSFEEVSGLITPGDRRSQWASTLDLWAGIIAEPYHEDAPPLLSGAPDTARAFFINPGRGCETGSFGFLKRSDAAGDHAEWFWHCSCKTPYASVVSDEHLIACHTGLVAVLDHARRLDIDVVVSARDRGCMLDDVAIFRTHIAIASLTNPDHRRELPDVMVGTGSEYNWIPSAVLLALGIAPVRIELFETADGRILEREIGFAFVFAGGRSAPTIVVFAGEGDMVLLGAIGLEGLNLRVDLSRKELISAGPLPAAGIVAAAA